MSEKNPWFEPGQPARPIDIKADKADLDMRLERKALAEGWDRTADKLDAAQSELAALREELAERKRKHLRSCQIAIGKSQLAKERHAELIQFDEGMRSLACSLGAGGYNAETLSADQLVGKVQWGIDHLLNVHEQRLAAAEQRNSDLMGSSSTVIGACESAIKHVLHNLKASGKRVDIGLAGSSCDEALRRVNQFRKAYAQPTESGASE